MPEKKVEGRRKLQISMAEDLYVNFYIRLQFDELKRNEFFREILRLYINKDEDFIKVLDKIKDKISKQQKRRKKIIENLRKKEKDFNQKYFLNKEETERVYDIIEKDLPSNDLE